MSLLPEEEVLLKPSPIVDLIHKRFKATTKKMYLPWYFLIWFGSFFFLSSHGYLFTLRVGRSKESSGGNKIGAIVSAADALVAEDEERKQTVINGLLSGTGDIAGSSCRFRVFKWFVWSLPIDTSDTRISDIFRQYRNPPRSPTPVQDGYVEEAEEEEEEAPVESIVDTDVTVSVAGDPTATLSSNLRFIQESEIEIPTFDGVWVEKADATGHKDVANGHVPEIPLAPVVDVSIISQYLEAPLTFVWIGKQLHHWLGWWWRNWPPIHREFASEIRNIGFYLSSSRWGNPRLC
jgi:hypothetical protein